MAEGRGRAEWERTSLICAILVNVNRGKKGSPVKPTAFNPYAQHRKGILVTKENIGELKQVFEAHRRSK